MSLCLINTSKFGDVAQILTSSLDKEFAKKAISRYSASHSEFTTLTNLMCSKCALVAFQQLLQSTGRFTSGAQVTLA